MKVVKILAIVAAVFVGIFVVIELLMRFAFPVSMEPVTRVVLNNSAPGIEENVVVYEIDELGLRGYQWGKTKKDGALRVLVAGGNSTNHLLQNAEDTWWGRLAKLLEEQTGRSVEIAAVAADSGGKIVPAAAAARKICKEITPDLILIQYGFGDVIGHPLDYKFDPNKLDRLSAEVNRNLKYKLAEVSQIARRIRRKRVARARRAGQARFEQPDVYLQMLNNAMATYRQAPFLTKLARTDDPMQEYLQGVGAFIALAKEKGAKLVVIGEPTLHHEFLGFPEDRRLHHLAKVGPDANDLARVSPTWLQSELDRYYMDGWKKCQEGGATFISLNAKIPRYSEYFLTEVLVTDKGAQLIAEKLMPVVKPLVQ